MRITEQTIPGHARKACLLVGYDVPDTVKVVQTDDIPAGCIATGEGAYVKDKTIYVRTDNRYILSFQPIPEILNILSEILGADISTPEMITLVEKVSAVEKRLKAVSEDRRKALIIAKFIKEDRTKAKKIIMNFIKRGLKGTPLSVNINPDYLDLWISYKTLYEYKGEEYTVVVQVGFDVTNFGLPYAVRTEFFIDDEKVMFPPVQLSVLNFEGDLKLFDVLNLSVAKNFDKGYVPLLKDMLKKIHKHIINQLGGKSEN